jgi:formylmethanofuran dehydrogenase subunit E
VDGLQASAGRTHGKLMIERQNYGKFAATLWTPAKGSVLVSIKLEFAHMLAKTEEAVPSVFRRVRDEIKQEFMKFYQQNASATKGTTP